MWYYLVFILVSELLILGVPNRKLRSVFTLIVASLAVLSFFINPSETWDLYRHYETIKMYGEFGLDWVLSNKLDRDPLSALYLYMYSLLGEPRLFPFVTVLVTYGFTFMLLFEAQKELNLSRKSLAWISFYLLSNWNYLLVVSNCRIFMLYAITAYFFYMELVRDRYHKLSFIVYVAACFFHYGIAIVLVARIILYLRKYIRNDVVLILLTFVVLSSYSYFFSFIGSNVLITTIEDKIVTYQGYMMFGSLQYVSSLLNIVLVLFVLIDCRWAKSDYNAFYLITLIVLVTIFAWITNYQIVIRETCLMASLAVVPIVVLFSKRTSALLINSIKMESVAILIYRCWYEYNLLDFAFTI